jgi:hypothetical protein
MIYDPWNNPRPIIRKVVRVIRYKKKKRTIMDAQDLTIKEQNEESTLLRENENGDTIDCVVVNQDRGPTETAPLH